MTESKNSVLSRAAPPPDLTLRYGGDAEHVIDVRLPPGPPAGPLVLFLHGGFWRAGYDRTHTGPLAADLAARGYPVACPEYRRLGQPGGGYPGTFGDVLAGARALPGLLARAGRADLATDPPVLAGHSAGGQLALWLAGRVPSQGVLALAPVADLAAGYAQRLGDGAVGDLLGGGPDRVPQRYAEVDPAAALPLPVPAALVHGDLDDRVPVGIARGYTAAAEATGSRVRLVELPGVEHFAVIDPLTPAWLTVLDTLRWVIDQAGPWTGRR